jgi:hypothetical protein
MLIYTHQTDVPWYLCLLGMRHSHCILTGDL